VKRDVARDLERMLAVQGPRDRPLRLRNRDLKLTGSPSGKLTEDRQGFSV
jgi:hypothetical protein